MFPVTVVAGDEDLPLAVVEVIVVVVAVVVVVLTLPDAQY
jgi:hypothetical protein